MGVTKDVYIHFDEVLCPLGTFGRVTGVTTSAIREANHVGSIVTLV